MGCGCSTAPVEPGYAGGAGARTRPGHQSPLRPEHTDHRDGPLLEADRHDFGDLGLGAGGYGESDYGQYGYESKFGGGGYDSGNRVNAHAVRAPRTGQYRMFSVAPLRKETEAELPLVGVGKPLVIESEDDTKVDIWIWAKSEPLLFFRGLPGFEDQVAVLNSHIYHPRRTLVGLHIFQRTELPACDVELGWGNRPNIPRWGSTVKATINWTGRILKGSKGRKVFLHSASHDAAQQAQAWESSHLECLWQDVAYNNSLDDFLALDIIVPEGMAPSQLYAPLLSAVRARRTHTYEPGYKLLGLDESGHEECSHLLLDLAARGLEQFSTLHRYSLMEYAQKQARRWRGLRSGLLCSLLLKCVSVNKEGCREPLMEQCTAYGMREVADAARDIHATVRTSVINQRLPQFLEWLEDIWQLCVSQSDAGEVELLLYLETLSADDMFATELASRGCTLKLQGMQGDRDLDDREFRSILKMFGRLPAMRKEVQGQVAKKLQRHAARGNAWVVHFISDVPCCFSKAIFTGSRPVVDLQSLPPTLLVRLFFAYLRQGQAYMKEADPDETQAFNLVCDRLRRVPLRKSLIDEMRTYREELTEELHDTVENFFRGLVLHHIEELRPPQAVSFEARQQEGRTIETMRADMGEQRVVFFVDQAWMADWQKFCAGRGVAPGPMRTGVDFAQDIAEAGAYDVAVDVPPPNDEAGGESASASASASSSEDNNVGNNVSGDEEDNPVLDASRKSASASRAAAGFSESSPASKARATMNNSVSIPMAVWHYLFRRYGVEPTGAALYVSDTGRPSGAVLQWTPEVCMAVDALTLQGLKDLVALEREVPEDLRQVWMPLEALELLTSTRAFLISVTEGDAAVSAAEVLRLNDQQRCPKVPGGNADILQRTARPRAALEACWAELGAAEELERLLTQVAQRCATMTPDGEASADGDAAVPALRHLCEAKRRLFSASLGQVAAAGDDACGLWNDLRQYSAPAAKLDRLFNKVLFRNYCRRSLEMSVRMQASFTWSATVAIIDSWDEVVMGYKKLRGRQIEDMVEAFGIEEAWDEKSSARITSELEELFGELVSEAVQFYLLAKRTRKYIQAILEFLDVLHANFPEVPCGGDLVDLLNQFLDCHGDGRGAVGADMQAELTKLGREHLRTWGERRWNFCKALTASLPNVRAMYEVLESQHFDDLRRIINSLPAFVEEQQVFESLFDVRTMLQPLFDPVEHFPDAGAVLAWLSAPSEEEMGRFESAVGQIQQYLEVFQRVAREWTTDEYEKCINHIQQALYKLDIELRLDVSKLHEVNLEAVEEKMVFTSPGWTSDRAEFSDLKMVEYRMFLYGEPKEEHRMQVETFHEMVSKAEQYARLRLNMMQNGFMDAEPCVKVYPVGEAVLGTGDFSLEQGGGVSETCDKAVHELIDEVRKNAAMVEAEEAILKRHGGTFLPLSTTARLLASLKNGVEEEIQAFEVVFHLAQLPVPNEGSRAEQLVELDNLLRDRVVVREVPLEPPIALRPFNVIAPDKVHLVVADAKRCPLLLLAIAAFVQVKSRLPRWYELLIYGNAGGEQAGIDEVQAFASRIAHPCREDDMYVICGWSYAPREHRALIREWLDESPEAHRCTLFISDGPPKSVQQPHAECVIMCELCEAATVATLNQGLRKMWSMLPDLLPNLKAVDSKIPGEPGQFHVGKSHRILRDFPGATRISLFHFYKPHLFLRDLQRAYEIEEAPVWIHISSNCPEDVEALLLCVFVCGLALDPRGRPVALDKDRVHVVELPRRDGFPFLRDVLPRDIIGAPCDELDVGRDDVQMVCRYLRELSKPEGESLLICRSGRQADFYAEKAQAAARNEAVDLLRAHGPKFRGTPAVERSMATLVQFIRYLHGQFKRLEASNIYFLNFTMAHMSQGSHRLKFITVTRLVGLAASMFDAALDVDTFELSRGWDEATRDPLIFLDRGEEPTLSVFLGPGQKDAFFNWTEVGFAEIDRSDSRRAREMLEICLNLPKVVVRLTEIVAIYVKKEEDLDFLRNALSGDGAIKVPELKICDEDLKRGFTVASHTVAELSALEPPARIEFITNALVDLLDNLDDNLLVTKAGSFGGRSLKEGYALVRHAQDRNDNEVTINSKEDLQNMGLPCTLTFLQEKAASADQGYVLTMDNVLKMILMTQRLESGPVVLMGETGCGKTSLVTYLCKVSGIELHALDVHGGIAIDDVREFMQDVIDQALLHNDTKYWIFLDELNTSPCIDVFVEMLCDSRFEGNSLPPNVRVLGACNPYRRSTKDCGDGLLRVTSSKKFGEIKASAHKAEPDDAGGDDELVYQVLPLPAALVDFIWDFGSLKEEERAQYVHQMVEEHVPECGNVLKSDAGAALPDLVVRGMNVVLRREDPSSVSLRDARRTVVLASWFHKSGASSAHAAVLAVVVSFYYRLTDVGDRKLFWKIVPEELYAPFESGKELLQTYQKGFTEAVHVPDGIARNEALTTNIFVMLAAVANRVPLFVVGKPGQSKTLAVSLLGGGRSSTEVETSVGNLHIPLVSVLSYQCSEHTTASSLDHHFVQGDELQRRRGGGGGAMKGKSSTGRCRVQITVFLDEVGLAEKNQVDKPLKVLHKHLENPSVAFIGLSNTPLDASKMNRAIYLTHLDPGRRDLQTTAKVMLSKSQLAAHLTEELAESISKLFLKVLTLLSKYKGGIFSHLADHRGFYNLIKGLARLLEDDPMADSLTSGGRNVCDLILRNLGGAPHEEMEALLLTPMEECGFREGVAKWRQVPYPENARRMMQQSLDDDKSRHLMVIAPSEIRALQFLFSQQVMDPQETEVFFGSSFEEDANSKLYIFRLLSKIRMCMEIGRRVVLLNLGRLHESLYEVLNQQYIYFNGKPTCRIALGSESRQVPVHKDFRCVVVLTSAEVHRPDFAESRTSMELRFLSALLSRFEKVVLSDEAELPPHLLPALSSMRAWMGRIGPPDAFFGCGSDAPALVLKKFINEVSTKAAISPERAEAGMQIKLLRMMPTFYVLKAADKLGKDKVKAYAARQCHRSLAVLLDSVRPGAPIIVRTFDDQEVGDRLIRADGDGVAWGGKTPEFSSKRRSSELKDSDANVGFSNDVDDGDGAGLSNDIGDEVYDDENLDSADGPPYMSSAQAPLVVLALRDFSTEYTFSRALAREIPDLQEHGTLLVDCNEANAPPAMLQHVNRLVAAAVAELPEPAPGRARRVVFLLRQQPCTPPPLTTVDFGTDWLHYWVEGVNPVGKDIGLDLEDMLRPPAALGDRLQSLIAGALPSFNINSFVEYPDAVAAARPPQELAAKILEDEQLLNLASKRLASALTQDASLRSWLTLMAREYPLGVYEPLIVAATHSLAIRAYEAFAELWTQLDHGANFDACTGGFGRNLWLNLMQVPDLVPLDLSIRCIVRRCDVRWPAPGKGFPFAAHIVRFFGSLQPLLWQHLGSETTGASDARWNKASRWLGNQMQQLLADIWDSVPAPDDWRDRQLTLLESFARAAAPGLASVIMPVARYFIDLDMTPPTSGCDLLRRVAVAGYVAQQALLGDQNLEGAVRSLWMQLGAGEEPVGMKTSSVEEMLSTLLQYAVKQLIDKAQAGGLITFSDLINAETILRATSAAEATHTLADIAQQGHPSAAKLLRLEAYADLALRFAASPGGTGRMAVVLGMWGHILLPAERPHEKKGGKKARTLEADLFQQAAEIKDTLDVASEASPYGCAILTTWLAQRLCLGVNAIGDLGDAESATDLLSLMVGRDFPELSALKLMESMKLDEPTVRALDKHMTSLLNIEMASKPLDTLCAHGIVHALTWRLEQDLIDGVDGFDYTDYPTFPSVLAVANVRMSWRDLRDEVAKTLSGHPTPNAKSAVQTFCQKADALGGPAIKNWGMQGLDDEFGFETLRSLRMTIKLPDEEGADGGDPHEPRTIHMLVPELLQPAETQRSADVLMRVPKFNEHYAQALAEIQRGTAPNKIADDIRMYQHAGLAVGLAVFTCVTDGSAMPKGKKLPHGLREAELLNQHQEQVVKALMDRGPFADLLKRAEVDIARLVAAAVAGALSAGKLGEGPIHEFLVRPNSFKDRFVWGMARTKYFDQLHEIKVSEYGSKLTNADYCPIYECPNRHPYWLGNCSRPWVVYNCAMCGERIGGTRHQLLEGNRQVPRPEWQQPQVGYCYSRFATFSDQLRPRHFLALHFWTHALLLGSILVNFDNKSAQSAKEFLPPKFPHSNAPIVEDLLRICGQALEQLMAEAEFPTRMDAANYLLLIFTSCNGLRQAFNGIDFREARGLANFEQAFSEFADQVANKHRVEMLRPPKKADDRGKPGDLPRGGAPVLLQLPSLARLRSLSLLDALPQLDAARERCPTFWMLHGEWRQLAYCAELPRLLRLPRVLFEGFSGRLSKVEALQLSLRKALGDRCGALWQEFAEAWNELRGLLTRVECAEVHLMELDPTKPAEAMATIVEFDRDMGMQLWNLIRQVAGYQNSFLEKLEAGGVGAVREDGSGAIPALCFERRFALPMRAFADGEAAEYGWASGVVPHAFRVAQSGKWVFHPEPFELEARALTAPLRPIALEPPPVFEFVALPSDDWQRLLNDQLPQEALAPDMTLAVARGVRPGGPLPSDLSLTLLQLVTKIAHQVLGGVRMDPKMKLPEKLLEMAQSGSSAKRGAASYRALFKHLPEMMDMRLCHLIGLWETVFEHFDPDYKSIVYPVYLDEMDDAEQHAVWTRVATWSRQDARALALWFKHMLSERLIEEGFPPASPMAHILYAVGESHTEYSERTDKLLDEGPEGFPNIPLRFAFAAYEIVALARAGTRPEAVAREQARLDAEAEERRKKEEEEAAAKAAAEAEAKALREAEEKRSIIEDAGSDIIVLKPTRCGCIIQ